MLVPNADGEVELIYFVDAVRPPYVTYSWSRFFVETLCAVLALARVAEHTHSVQWSPFAFHSAMKTIDLVNCASMFLCYIIRLTIALIYAEEFDAAFTTEVAIEQIGSAGHACANLDGSCPELTRWSRTTLWVMSLNASLASVGSGPGYSFRQLIDR